eukprot:scaffold189_cov249-Pinguiococcus_pyrenoidosus.AAC.3
MVQPQTAQHCVQLPLRHVVALHLHDEAEHFLHRELAEEGVVLRQHRHVSVLHANGLGALIRHLPGEHQASPPGEHAPQGAEQHGLAAAGGAQDGQQAAIPCKARALH